MNPRRTAVTIMMLYLAGLVVLSQRLIRDIANTIRRLVGQPEFEPRAVEEVSLVKLVK